MTLYRLNSGLDMSGHIDDVFSSGIATQTYYPDGSYVDGVFENGVPVVTTHVVNVQPLNDKELKVLDVGGKRIKDVRKVYINDGTQVNIKLNSGWVLPDIEGVFHVNAMDNRKGRNYCKLILVRMDV